MLTPSKKRTSVVSTIRRQTLDTMDPHKNYMYAFAGKPLRDILTYSKPLCELPTAKPKVSSRVITGEQAQRDFEEKSFKKAQKQYDKQERKQMRKEKKGLALMLYACAILIFV